MFSIEIIYSLSYFPSLGTSECLVGQIISLQSLGFKGRTKLLFHFSMSLFVFLLSDCTGLSPVLQQTSCLALCNRQQEEFGSLDGCCCSKKCCIPTLGLGGGALHTKPGQCRALQQDQEPYRVTHSTGPVKCTAPSSSSSLVLLLHQWCYAHPERLSSRELNILSLVYSAHPELWLHIHRVSISIARCQEQS